MAYRGRLSAECHIRGHSNVLKAIDLIELADSDGIGMDTLLDSATGMRTTHSESDEAIAVRALYDPDAFTALYRDYALDVYRYCYRRLGNREAAEDATSQTFTNAYIGLRRLGDKPFRPWLFAIAHNVVVDAYRGHASTAPLDGVLDRQDPGESPEELAIGQERSGAVHQLLQQLPQRDREVVELRLAGLSGPEIAQALQCSHDAVRAAHHRAIQRLRALCEQGVLCASLVGGES